MMNIKDEIEKFEAANGERVTAIVVGPFDGWPRKNEGYAPIVMTRAQGLAKLDYEYDNGYGCSECHPFYAWTANYILLMQEYDGATSIASIPRKPVAVKPEFNGEAAP